MPSSVVKSVLAIFIFLPIIANSIRLRRTDDDTSYLNFMPHPHSRLVLPADMAGVRQQSVSVSKPAECPLACLDEPWCHSVNLKVKPTRNGKLVCELLSSDKYNHSRYFVDDKEFTHLSLQSVCESSPCSVHGKCVALYDKGDFYCACAKGYTGRLCRDDVNECATGRYTCHAHARCTNTQGSYTCACNSGYHGSGKVCADVNECSTGRYTCHAHARCVNTQGSYSCACNSGYHGSGKVCTDVNECSTGRYSCHARARCVNTQGSYRCACNSGYHGSGKVCTADCKTAYQSYTYYVTSYYSSYYYTSCGFLGTSRCKRSRYRSRSTRKTGTRLIHIAVRPGASCP